MQEGLAVPGDRQDTFSAAQKQHSIRSGLIQGQVLLIRIQGKSGGVFRGLLDFLPSGKDGTEILKCNRVQILDHIRSLLEKEKENRATVR